jgi:hypothetical protein
MRTTITLDDQLLRRAKHLALESNQTLSEIISDALREMLRRQSRPEGRPVPLPTAGRGSKLMPGVDVSSNEGLWDVLSDSERERLAQMLEESE